MEPRRNPSIGVSSTRLLGVRAGSRVLEAYAPRGPARAISVLLFLMLGWEPGLEAQSWRSAAARGVGERLAVADRLYLDLRPQDALDAYRAVLQEAPQDFETLWRASRAALALGWLEPNEPVSVGWYREAEAYARQALRVAPERLEGHFWLAAAVGRRAQIAKTVRTAAQLADEVYREATLVLTMDPRHAGAHNVLGQLHYEVLTTPWALRVLGLQLLGGGLDFEASWDEAERLLRSATVLDPRVILYRLELARLYVWQGRRELAEPELEAALALPILHPPDPLFKREAQAMLESIH
ncbi:MAG: hypothetical protein HY704_10385 [Gemmatimonadetes bacterium]|nr:hypothetical protein [Gemmatimonadota bacterium]